MSSFVCKISFKSVQVCGGCCKMFRGITFFGTQCICKPTDAQDYFSALKVTFQVTTQGAESAVCDCLVVAV